MREVNDTKQLRVSPKKSFNLMHYILMLCWLYLLDVLGHYVIWTGAIEWILVTTNNLMNLGYI